MEKSLGNDPRSGSNPTTKKPKTAKRINWKNHCMQLDKRLEELLRENSGLSQRLSETREDLDDSRRLHRVLKDDLKQARKELLRDRDAIVLRNLKYFHRQMVNVQLSCEEDKKKITRLASEASRLIKEEF